MAFIRTKRVKGILYRYRVESARVGGKVQQRVLEYLGRASTKPAKSGRKARKATVAPGRAARGKAVRAKQKAGASARGRKKRK